MKTDPVYMYVCTLYTGQDSSSCPSCMVRAKWRIETTVTHLPRPFPVLDRNIYYAIRSLYAPIYVITISFIETIDVRSKEEDLKD